MGKQGGLPKGEEIKDEDIRIASLGYGFPPGIEWVYGELQLHTPWYAFSYRTQPSPEAVTYMQRSDTKTWMDAVKS